jgi:intracellular multiplication protein IcmK
MNKRLAILVGPLIVAAATAHTAFAQQPPPSGQAAYGSGAEVIEHLAPPGQTKAASSSPQGPNPNLAPPQRTLPIPIAPPTVREAVREQVIEVGDAILDPEDVGSLKDKRMRYSERERAPTYPGNKMPKPVSRSIVIEPDPTQPPRVIRLSGSTITSFVFSDMTGNPWNIESKSFDLVEFCDGLHCGSGAASATPASVGKGQAPQGADAPTNILTLLPSGPYSFGNIVVTLKGFPSPIVFMLAAGRSNEVDVRVTVRVQGHNPDAKAEIVEVENLPEHDPSMQDFLDGVAPPSSRQLKLPDDMGQAWHYKGAMYLRTRFEVLSPAFRNHVGSADGMHVYKFMRIEPLVTVTNVGRPDVIVVSGY